MPAPDHAPLQRKYIAWSVIAALAIVATAVWLAFAFLKPTPPRVVTVATGPEGGTGAEIGSRYREILARDGIELRLSPSAGAVENVARLRDPKSGVSVAVIPGGITTRRDSPELVSLGTLGYLPLWIFSHGQPLAKDLRRSRNLRVSVGGEGSGSRAFAVEFLARLGLVDGRNASFLALAPQEAGDKLVRGEIDAAIILDAWESPLVQRLLAAKDVHLVSAPRADSWVALYPYLSKVVLPAGVADMARDLPPANVTLLAPKANLVVREDLHPAIQYLLLDAAARIHSGPGVFQKAGEFPAPEAGDFPLSDQARQFYKTGPPFLQRHLPFWLAILIQQLLVLLIPVLGLMYPLLKAAPGLYVWVMRGRVMKLYGELKLLEEELSAPGASARMEELVERLERLDERVHRVRVPPPFRPLLYQLMMHISLVRQRMKRA